MTLHDISRPAAAAPKLRWPPLLRRLAEVWWLGVRTHVAELNGLPRPGAPPPPPDQAWPFGHM